MSPNFECLPNHTENDCPLQMVDCAFKYAGCQWRLPRKDMPDHISHSLALHMSLQATNHQQELKKLTSRISELETQLGEATVKLSELETKNHLLQEALDQECKNRIATVGRELKQAHEQWLKGHLGNLRGEIKKAQNETKQEIMKHVDIMESKIAVVHNHIGIVPVVHTMLSFEEKKSSNSTWYGPSFYTHPCGYKMCLRVDANGDGDGASTHVSVFLCIMRGEYDKFLKWPIRADVTVQLLNQVGDDGHHARVIDITDRADEMCKRVQLGEPEQSPNGWGYAKFICHDSLLPKYLKDNCLKLCIKEVKLNN